MGKKKSSKSISQIKKSNQKRNKLVKKGKIKPPNSKPQYVQSNKKASFSRSREERITDRERQKESEFHRQKLENEAIAQLADDLDEEEKDFILSNAGGYDIYETAALKRIRQRTSDSDESNLKHLLPVKTKDGIQHRSVRVIEEEKSDEEEEEASEESFKDESSEAQIEGFDENVTVVSILTKRTELIDERRILIGSLASNFLELPEERTQLLEKLVKLMDESEPSIALTVFRMSALSVLEIFRDVLPAYRIQTSTEEGVKLKKETLKLKKYESSILTCLQTFLVKLEKRLKASDSSSVFALKIMGELLIARPSFNFSDNIINVICSHANSKKSEYRFIVKNVLKEIFKSDKKGAVSLNIVLKLNKLSKTTKTLHTEPVDVLIYLPIHDINSDKLKDDETAKDKSIKRSKKLIETVSKKEKKRSKKMEKLKKELLEVQGEESSSTRQRNYSEITKLVFAIYFRIIKGDRKSSLLLPVLKGLSKFAHSINIDFFGDLLKVFESLLLEESRPLNEALHIIKTVFVVLSGQGECLNIDPAKFYKDIYNRMTSLDSISGEECKIAVSSLTDMLVKRKKKISSARAFSFAKRFSTISLNVNGSSALGFLGLLRELSVARPELKTLTEVDEEFGSGFFDPFVLEPENANAANTNLWELHSLRRHANPDVRSLSEHLLAKEGSKVLPKDFRIRATELMKEPQDIFSKVPTKPQPKKRKMKIVHPEDEPNPAKRFRNQNFDKWLDVVHSIVLI